MPLDHALSLVWWACFVGDQIEASKHRMAPASSDAVKGVQVQRHKASRIPELPHL